MAVLGRRLMTVAAILALSVGNLAVCAGWQATPEARMACCKSGTSCPMHKPAPRGNGSTRGVSQAQADTCCAAASNRALSSVAHSTFVVTAATALPSAAAVVPVAVPALQEWRTLVPLPASPVPKHLFLSVLLV